MAAEVVQLREVAEANKQKWLEERRALEQQLAEARSALALQVVHCSLATLQWR